MAEIVQRPAAVEVGLLQEDIDIRLIAGRLLLGSSPVWVCTGNIREQNIKKWIKIVYIYIYNCTKKFDHPQLFVECFMPLLRGPGQRKFQGWPRFLVRRLQLLLGDLLLWLSWLLHLELLGPPKPLRYTEMDRIRLKMISFWTLVLVKTC